MIITPNDYDIFYDTKAPKRAFRQKDVADVDYLVRISRGVREIVETSKDWGIVAKLFEFWTRRWPNEWVEYLKTIKDIRATRANKQGLSKSRGIKYVGALPVRFQRLIQAVFPLQQFDKEFVNKLTNNIQIVKVGEKNDTWFTIPDAPSKRISTTEIVEKAVKKLNDNTN
jgi:hypothetical protein